MTDALMTEADQKEALSLVYANAVAACAGYVTARPDLDRDSVDLRIQAGGAMRPALELQLKATANLAKGNDGHFHYPLKRRNYDQLRIETQTPRLLVVLDLPDDKERWVTITEEELVLRRRAYWLNLKGYVETENLSTVTVRIPTRNVFDVKNLHSLMEQSREGSIQ